MTKSISSSLPKTPQERANTVYWTRDLEEAIGRNDDRAVWQLIALQHDQEDAHDALATRMSRLRYRMAGQMHFAEMFMIPVITEGSNQPNLKDRTRWMSANYAIHEGLDIWKPRRDKLNLSSGFVPLDQMTLWKSEILRKRLLNTVPGQNHEGVKLVVEDIDLPPGAPRLWFLQFVLTSEESWPRVPVYDLRMDERLQQVVRFAITGHGEDAPFVLPPESVQNSMADGVCMWLLKLSTQIGIKGWSAVPGVSTPDIIKITLAFAGEEQHLTQFFLRRHQLGAQGLNDCLTMLQGLAPMLDTHPIQPEDSAVKVMPNLFH